MFRRHNDNAHQENAGHQAHGHPQEETTQRRTAGSVLAEGVSALLAHILPQAFKSAKIHESGTQAATSPLGARLVMTYDTTIEVEGAPEVIQAIEEAAQETERAQIEAEAAAGNAHAEAREA